MTNYKYIFKAFLHYCGDKHGATFTDENIDTLHVDGVPATEVLIKQIKDLAQQLSDEDQK